jgi:hypothetical protein
MKTISFATFALAVILASQLPAQEPVHAPDQTNLAAEKAKEGNKAASVTRVDEAANLVHFARENQSPVAMLAAVEILQTTRLQQDDARFGAKRTGAIQPGEQPSTSNKPADKPLVSLDPQKLLAEAQPWAKGDPNTAALISGAMKRSARSAGGTLGATNGAVAHYDSVNARDYDDFNISFRGGELARIAVIGDGDTDIDLFVYDENGHEIARDDDRTADCVVSFTPRWTGSFRVRVLNNGRVYSNYLLATN